MFVFLHTADWQIGKPFGAFPQAKAALLRDARLSSIDRLAEAARRHNAAHVVVAGDVFDGELVSDGDIAKAMAKMSRAGGITWQVISGNHDPARPGGIWERVARLGVPANVVLHLGARPMEIARGVTLLPAPLAAKRTSIDPTAWMDTAPSPEGHIRIGLAHGSVEGFGGDGEAEVPIAPSRAMSAGLDYLALGDWHGVARINERTWYSGTPEPDRYPDNEPGEALLVRISGRAVAPEVTRVATRHYRWMKLEMALTDCSRVLDFVGALRAEEPNLDRVLLRLKLSGRLPQGELQRVTVALAGLEPLLLHYDCDLAGLIAELDGEDLSESLEGALADVAASLKARASSAAGEGAAVAERALGLLYRYAARRGGEVAQ